MVTNGQKQALLTCNLLQMLGPGGEYVLMKTFFGPTLFGAGPHLGKKRIKNPKMLKNGQNGLEWVQNGYNLFQERSFCMLHKSGKQNNWSTLSILPSEVFLRGFAHGLVLFKVHRGRPHQSFLLIMTIFLKICTSNPMATREISDKFPDSIYKMRNLPSAAMEI